MDRELWMSACYAWGMIARSALAHCANPAADGAASSVANSIKWRRDHLLETYVISSITRLCESMHIYLNNSWQISYQSDVKWRNLRLFSVRQHMLSALYAIARPSVRPSHGWISRKQLKSGSCSFHHTVALSLWFLHDKFHPEIMMGCPRAVASNKGGLGETSYFRSSNAFARWLHKLDVLSQLRCPTSNLIVRWRHCRVITVASAALSCFEEHPPTRTRRTTRWVQIWDQFLIQKFIQRILLLFYCRL